MRFPHRSAAARTPRWAALVAGVLVAIAPGSVQAQSVTVAGRPFVLVAQSGRADTVAGFIQGFGRAQLVGQSVLFVTRGPSEVTGVHSGRGGNASVVRFAGPGSSGPAGPLQVFHDGFVTGTAETAPVLAAGASRADGLFGTASDPLTSVLAPGTVLPGSGGLVLNALGEPNLVDGRLAVIGWHTPAAGGVTFRGVYRVEGGALLPVSDTATDLPGGYGAPGTFSSQVGWDGATLAFWAGRGASSEDEGMFAWTSDGGVRLLLRTGDPIPGGGVVDGMISPPVVSGGAVYFYAYEADGRTHLLRHRDGVLTRLVGDGDLTPEGIPLVDTGHIGLAVEAGRVWFPAITGGGSALYYLEDGELKTAIAPGSRILGIRADTFVLMDVAGDTVVLVAVSGSTQYLLANLASPAPPVIVEEPADLTVAAGAVAELRVTALGDGPLTYFWRRGGTSFPPDTGPVLTLPSAGASEVGTYRVTVSNALGRVESRNALLNVEVAPVFVSQVGPRTVEEGDPLILNPAAIGGLPLAYHWTRNGEPLGTGGTAASIVRNGATPEDAGEYRLTVSNAWGQATSDPIPVSVVPPPPNPLFAGRRLAPVITAASLLPGTAETVDTSMLSEYSARWTADGLLFVGRGAAGTASGVLRWADGVLSVRLAPGVELANGLGPALEYGFIQGGTASDPLLVTARRPGQFGPADVGIHRVVDGGLEVLADTTTPVPDGAGLRFDQFSINAQGGERVLISAKFGNVAGLHLLGPGGPVRLLSGAQSLPVVGTDVLQFQSIELDGDTYVAVASSSGLQKQVALLGGVGGGLTALIARDDPIPGTDKTVRSFGPSAMRDGTVFLMVYDPGFAQHVLAWRDGSLTRVAGPGMQVGDLGTIQSLESSFPVPAGGRAHVAARVTTASGVVRAVVAAGPDGIEPIITARKLDGRRVTLYSVVAAETDRLALLVQFESGTRELYANVGPGDVERPTLGFARLPGNRLGLAVPGGWTLESAPGPAGPWEPVGGSGTVEVVAGAGDRYYRLRR